MRKWILRIFVWGFIFCFLACSQFPREDSADNQHGIKAEENGGGIAPDQEYIMPRLLKQAEEEGKMVFLVIGSKRCSPCKRLNYYHHDSAVSRILSKYFLIQEFDAMNSVEGKELYKKYWKPGFPAWTILDPAGNVLGDSGIPGKGYNNIGYPEKEEDIDHYLKNIRTAAPSLTDQECKLLAGKLRSYGKKEDRPEDP